MARLGSALAAFAAAATLGASMAAADPGPGPTNPPKVDVTHVDPKLHHRIAAVNAELDRLSRHNAQLDERYDVAVTAVTAARRTAHRARQVADRAEARYRAAHERLLQAAVQRYESGPSPSLGELLTSGAPQQYLDGITMANYLSSQFAATVHADRAAHAAAAHATHRAAAALATARAREDALAQRRAALSRQAQRFHQLLDTLTARQRRELAHARAVAAAKARAELAAQRRAARQQAARSTQPPAASKSPPVAGTGSVQRVIAFAEAQVGKAYSYGGAGPDAYDCSGLTMSAWAQAGVHLPHSAAEQYSYGTHVAYSQLRPGDLIFLYSPIGHVELYVGRDLAVSAADPATGIVYVHPSQDMADYAGATRLIG